MAANPVPMISEGVVFATLSDKSKDEVLQEVGKIVKDRFAYKKEAIKNAFDFRKLVGDDRYDMYKGRTAQEWADLKTTFPEQYSEQIRDFYILERRIKASQTRVAGAATDEAVPDIGV